MDEEEAAIQSSCIELQGMHDCGTAEDQTHKLMKLETMIKLTYRQ